jgi:cobalt-zinc-cadmium resistance protein CzcA
VKRQLSGIPGIVEISSFGGYLKQYEVAVDPDKMRAENVTISEVFDALKRTTRIRVEATLKNTTMPIISVPKGW